jgi:hypothetical protein
MAVKFLNRTALVAAILMLAAVGLISCKGKKAESAGAAQTTPSETTPPGSDSLTIVLAGRDSVSVFDLLRESHKVDYFSTAAGTFVKGIDSLETGSRVFWIYSVNGKMPEIASDKWITKAGDQVVWHYRKLNQ